MIAIPTAKEKTMRSLLFRGTLPLLIIIWSACGGVDVRFEGVQVVGSLSGMPCYGVDAAGEPLSCTDLEGDLKFSSRQRVEGVFFTESFELSVEGQWLRTSISSDLYEGAPIIEVSAHWGEGDVAYEVTVLGIPWEIVQEMINYEEGTSPPVTLNDAEGLREFVIDICSSETLSQQLYERPAERVAYADLCGEAEASFR
jgi:hypothetical protein